MGSVSTFLPEKYLIPDDSIGNLSKSIVKIFNEKNLYDIDQKSLKSKYTWSNVIKNYERVYKDIL